MALALIVSVKQGETRKLDENLQSKCTEKVGQNPMLGLKLAL